jgi:hypothetical protein
MGRRSSFVSAETEMSGVAGMNKLHLEAEGNVFRS